MDVFGNAESPDYLHNPCHNGRRQIARDYEVERTFMPAQLVIGKEAMYIAKILLVKTTQVY